MKGRQLVPLLAGLLALACGDSSDSTFDDGNAKESSGGPGNGGFGGNGPNGDGGTSSGSNPNCKPNLTGLVRDFRAKGAANGHPDFEAFGGTAETTGLVEGTLGKDKKPVFKSIRGDGGADQLTSKADFDVWYRDTPGVNMTFPYELTLKPGAGGILTFSSNAFFPIDNRGFGNSGKDANEVDHNFHFTFELHLRFTYKGGETFTFTGDDDLWTFINGKLGIDLGGLHPATTKTIDLDANAKELGIEKGQTYDLDVFHAERHTNKSNFRIDTTLEFVNCDPILIPR